MLRVLVNWSDRSREKWVEDHVLSETGCDIDE